MPASHSQCELRHTLIVIDADCRGAAEQHGREAISRNACVYNSKRNAIKKVPGTSHCRLPGSALHGKRLLASKPELRNFLSHLLGGNPELEKYRSARMLAPEGQYT